MIFIDQWSQTMQWNYVKNDNFPPNQANWFASISNAPLAYEFTRLKSLNLSIEWRWGKKTRSDYYEIKKLKLVCISVVLLHCSLTTSQTTWVNILREDENNVVSQNDSYFELFEFDLHDSSKSLREAFLCSKIGGDHSNHQPSWNPSLI